MGTSKRDGFYKRGKVWWTRHPVTKQRASTHCTDLEAARRWRAAQERIAADPAYHAAQNTKLGERVALWLAKKASTASPATMIVARQKLGHWVRIVGTETPLSELTPQAFDDYWTQRRTENVSDHTVSKEVTHMLAVLKDAKRVGYYAGDISTLRPPELHAGYEPRDRALTRHELVALLSELEPRRAALVAVCVALGCRLGEAMRLLPTDIEADKVFIRGTKTKGSRREVPILSIYRPLLDAARPYLPLEPWGKVQRDLAAACRRARIDKVSPNDLRRTHATLLVEAGVDLYPVSKMLGHTTTVMVQRVYGKPSSGAIASLVEQKLLDAAPVPTVHDRHNSEDSSENIANAPVAQWIEQRFPKPNQANQETAANSESGEKDADSESADDGEDPPKRGGTGTRKAQRVSAGGWALAYAARDVAARHAARLSVAS